MHHAKLKDKLYIFSFNFHPMSPTEMVISDTQYAYLPSDMFNAFISRGWARSLTDEEAEKINNPKPTAPVVEKDTVPSDGAKTVTKFGKDK